MGRVPVTAFAFRAPATDRDLAGAGRRWAAACRIACARGAALLCAAETGSRGAAGSPGAAPASGHPSVITAPTPSATSVPPAGPIQLPRTGRYYQRPR